MWRGRRLAFTLYDTRDAIVRRGYQEKPSFRLPE